MLDDDISLEGIEAICQGCDSFASVDDLGLCAACAAKLDRDMIRQRYWDYSATAFLTPKDQYEELRAHIIKVHGAALELIASDS
jgi:predicted amidophosphoribosyltransferase